MYCYLSIQTIALGLIHYMCSNLCFYALEQCRSLQRHIENKGFLFTPQCCVHVCCNMLHWNAMQSAFLCGLYEIPAVWLGSPFIWSAIPNHMVLFTSGALKCTAFAICVWGAVHNVLAPTVDCRGSFVVRTGSKWTLTELQP